MAKPNPRRQNGWRRSQLRKKYKAIGAECALCHRPIDYSLPPGLPGSFELDEITTVKAGGSPIDPDNVQPVHRCCNQKRGDMTLEAYFAQKKPMPIHCSRDW